MPKDTAKKWKHHRVITVTAAKRDAANTEMIKWGWGPDFYSIPLAGKISGKIEEYGADVVLTEEMLKKLDTLPQALKSAVVTETAVTAAKGSAKLKEVAAKRGVEIKKIEAVGIVEEEIEIGK